LTSYDVGTGLVDAVATAAERLPGPRVLPWPLPGNMGAFVTFESFGEWQTTLLSFCLPSGVPRNMVDGFERALKLYLLAWLDFDVITAGELAALSALEHVLRDCYLGKMRERHNKKLAEKVTKTNRPPGPNPAFRPEKVPFADLLKYMVECDALTDAKLPCARRYGASVMPLLTGNRKPSLAAIRNTRAHGNPFGSGYQSGLFELVRDLIVYAYRDRITEVHAAGLTP
jgi:hypothetical protein